MIRLTNYSETPFSGWVRTTIDRLPLHRSGRIGDALYVVGRRIGKSTWTCDVKARIEPSQILELNLDQSTITEFALGAPPLDATSFFGGTPKINGQPLLFEKVSVDGSAFVIQMHLRVGPMLHVRMWFLWRPDEPWCAHGECVVTASNGAVPDLFQAAQTLDFSWGDAMIHVQGLGWTTSILRDTVFANGQARAFPLSVIWPRHMNNESWLQVVPMVRDLVCGAGIEKLLPGGNPRLPVGFSGKVWTQANYGRALAALHTWDAGPIGPSKRSSDTGAQEDQVFVRGECFAPDGLGAEKVAYYTALSMLKRPCHHLEANGSQADPTMHPGCVFWGCVPHYNLVVSPDQLGKPRMVTTEEAYGWSGPDREHWLCNTVVAAAKLTGSYALQWELEQQARIFLFSETVPSMKPGWSTNGADAARSVGWAGILVVHLWECLEDRVLAQRVVDRWNARLREVYLPQITNDIWDIRTNDPRLGQGDWWMPWQQAVGAYGLHLASSEFGSPEGMALAQKAARKVLQDAFRFENGGLLTSAQRPVLLATAPAYFDPSFNYFGMPLAVATILRSNPVDPVARPIWDWLVANAGWAVSWLPPEGP